MTCRVVLVGNPNCGKTTLFNALTGDNQRVGNWPGVTVERKTGQFKSQDNWVEVTDLPGVYSLTAYTEGLGQDEVIAAEAIANLEYDCIINVIDACHLERHLYLTTQILELSQPVIIALNMTDLAEQRGIIIDVDALAEQLGCPVFPVQAHKNKGISFLKSALVSSALTSCSPLKLPLAQVVHDLLSVTEIALREKGYSRSLAYYFARRYAEGGNTIEWSFPVQEDVEMDVLLADARYQKIHQIVCLTQKKCSDARESFTAKVDRVVLHRFFALPLFFFMMYVMFLFAIKAGGVFQNFFDMASETVFVQGSTWLLQQLHSPNWLIALLANGIGNGIKTTLTFIPVIAAMFFFLSLLEVSGYMARAAFVVDKIMQFLGLPGKSFVPMIIGFGCNVPAIMAARTLDTERDRFLTIMMTPFMSCSARLAIYAVFVTAFFPDNGQNIVFSLYLVGVLMAVFTGYLLRKTFLKGTSAPLILELPTYHRPSLKRLIKETRWKLQFFVLRAGKIIIPVCVILGVLNSLMLGGGLNTGEADSQSILSVIGQWITPLFKPMGIAQENWPATVGLLTGMLAKEVVIGTLNTLYAQVGHFNAVATAPFDFWGGIYSALRTVPMNLSQLGSALWHPFLASAADNQTTHSMYGMMVERFDGKVGAYAYLLFVLLYVPCVSTMAVIRQEASRRLMWMSIVWSMVIAYVTAVVFYQLAHFNEHPFQSLLWALAIAFIFLLPIGFSHRLKMWFGDGHVIATT